MRSKMFTLILKALVVNSQSTIEIKNRMKISAAIPNLLLLFFFGISVIGRRSKFVKIVGYIYIYLHISHDVFTRMDLCVNSILKCGVRLLRNPLGCIYHYIMFEHLTACR